MRFNPSARVNALSGSIMAREFDVDYFKQFTIVMNALDNIGASPTFSPVLQSHRAVCAVAARRHVNRMCLAADIPLIESGTAGYLGQVTVIRKVPLLLLRVLVCMCDLSCFLVLCVLCVLRAGQDGVL